MGPTPREARRREESRRRSIKRYRRSRPHSRFSKASTAKFQTNLATYVNAHPESKAAFESMPNVNVSPLFADTVFAFADEPQLVYDLVRQPLYSLELTNCTS